jgi:hypothetical protein
MVTILAKSGILAFSEPRCTEANSVERNHAAYEHIRTFLDKQSAIPNIPVQNPTTLHQQISSGRHIQSTTGKISDWHVDVLLDQQRTRQSVVQYYYGERPPPSTVDRKGKGKRPAAQSSAGVAVKKRKTRSCARCGETDCPGDFLSKPCKYHPAVGVCHRCM